MKILASEIAVRWFGKLRIKEPQDLLSGSHKKVVWTCDCGREVSAIIKNVLSGRTASCGACSMMPASSLRDRKFGKLRMKEPQDMTPSSYREIEWVCDCGRTAVKQFKPVYSGNTKSCGMCNLIPAEKIADQKFGSLRMLVAQDTLPRSHKKVEWACDCGRTLIASIADVLSRHTESCGMCNTILASEIASRRFGKLRIKEPQDVLPGSGKKIAWTCDCGRETLASVTNVVCGQVASCGNCRDAVLNWFLNNRDHIRELKCPLSPGEMPPGGIVPSETIRSAKARFQAVCPSCKGAYAPRLHDIKQGKSLTCGCATFRVSSGVREIADFLKSSGIDVKLEYKAGGLAYDLFIPQRNTLIEFNGLRWHSMPESRSADARKYEMAISNGYELMSVFADEWRFGRPKVESLLQNRFGLIKTLRIRPSECFVRAIAPEEADSFYARFHYIGPCRPKVSYGVFYQDRLIACISFSRPTRQSSHPWELVRMASDPGFRVHGIWSKLLKMFVKEYEPSSIVSFSDNRLFSGAVYERMGFSLDGEVPPDYYWVKGQRRFHKSGLRKRGEERTSGKTEAQLREAQGYRKIWDLGKKRWVYSEKGHALG